MTQYQRIELNLSTGHEKSRSKHYSSRTLVNMYIDSSRAGRTDNALMPWLGEKPFSTGTTGKNRGFWLIDNTPYILVDRNLSKILSDGRQVYIADIPGVNHCSFASDGVSAVIRNAGSVAYINQKYIALGSGATYVLQNGTLTSVPIPEIPRGGFAVSMPGDPYTWQAEDVAVAELAGDNGLQVFVFQRKILIAGERSIELFYDDPNASSPPILPMPEASTTELGVASPHTMAQTVNFLYFLGSDGVVYQVADVRPQSITSSGIASEIRAFNKQAAIGFTCSIEGQYFYILQFPENNSTLCFSENAQEWIKLCSGTEFGRHFANGYQYAYNKHLIPHFENGSVAEWDANTYTSLNGVLIRRFDSVSINSQAILNVAGARLITNRIQILSESGVGNALDFDPEIMIQASIDGGRTFSAPHFLKLNRAGDSVKSLDWFKCISFYDLIIRITVSDPIFFCLHSVVVFAKPAGF